MLSFYSVVQYVPDVLADERINVGVVAWGDGRVRVRWLRDWERVRLFAGHDVSNLARDLAREGAGWTEEQVVRQAGRSGSVVQFTGPRPSIRNPDQVLVVMAKLFLRETGREACEGQESLPIVEVGTVAASPAIPAP
jgi:hypothetical protein